MKPAVILAVVTACTYDAPELVDKKFDDKVQVLAHDCHGDLPGEQVDSFRPNTGGLHVIGIGQATWTTHPQAELQRVIVTGVENYNFSTAIAPAGVDVEIHEGFGYAYVHYTEDELELTCEDVYGAAGLPEYCPDIGQWFLEGVVD